MPAHDPDSMSMVPAERFNLAGSIFACPDGDTLLALRVTLAMVWDVEGCIGSIVVYDWLIGFGKGVAVVAEVEVITDVGTMRLVAFIKL